MSRLTEFLRLVERRRVDGSLERVLAVSPYRIHILAVVCAMDDLIQGRRLALRLIG